VNTREALTTVDLVRRGANVRTQMLLCVLEQSIDCLRAVDRSTLYATLDQLEQVLDRVCCCVVEATRVHASPHHRSPVLLCSFVGALSRVSSPSLLLTPLLDLPSLLVPSPPSISLRPFGSPCYSFFFSRRALSRRVSHAGAGAITHGSHTLLSDRLYYRVTPNHRSGCWRTCGRSAATMR
jgi:hypothetical protein